MSWTRNSSRILHRREHAGDFLGQRRDLIRGRALGGQAGRADFEDAPRLVHLFAGEAVERGEKAQRLACRATAARRE